jgi:tetratricopeptide (TPR) repeat protein
MWLDPLIKWRHEPATEEPSQGAAELLAGRPDEARSLFQSGGSPRDLVGLGDALILLGRPEEAIEHFESAAGLDSSVFVECGLSQALILRGDAGRAVERLEPLLRRSPEDPVLRHHLSAALLSVADQARSVTRDEQFVITSQAQIDICARVAGRVAGIAASDQHVAAARQLDAEIQRGQRWVWSSETAALGLSLLVALAGIALAALGGGTGNVALVVLAAVLGAVAIYGIVIAFRRQAWQIQATEVAHVVWRRGVA